MTIILLGVCGRCLVTDTDNVCKIQIITIFPAMLIAIFGWGLYTSYLIEIGLTKEWIKLRSARSTPAVAVTS